MTDRGPIARCLVKACPCVGHFAHHDGLCPIHRDPHTDKPPGRAPTLAEAFDLDSGGG